MKCPGMPQLLQSILALIGRRGYVLYAASAILLMAPSFLLWFKPSWEIMGHEFDFWIGQFPAGTANSAFVLKMAGNFLQSLLFLTAGLGFWASFQTLESDLARGVKVRLAGKVALILGICCLGIPWFNVDCFYYLAKGWLEIGYGVDVFRTAINGVPGYEQDVFFRNVFPGFLNQPGNYGPLFQYFAKTLAWMGDGNFILTFVLMRVVFLTALLASAWVVALLANRVGSSPVLVVYFFLCNPLVLFNSVTALHNDVVSNLFVLLALLFAWDRRPFWAGIFLGLGAAWKFVPLLLFPPFTLYFLRREKKLAPAEVILFLAGLGFAFGMSFLLYPSSFAVFTAVASTGLVTLRSSLALFLIAALGPFLGFADGFALAKTIMHILFFGFSTWLLWPYLTGSRLMTGKVLLFVSFLIYLLYIFVGASQVEEWYMTWFLAMGFLLKEEKIRYFCLMVAVFYMPWVHFMCEQPITVMAISQVGVYALFAWLLIRLVVKPFFFSEKKRDELLGKKTVSTSTAG